MAGSYDYVVTSSERATPLGNRKQQRASSFQAMAREAIRLADLARSGNKDEVIVITVKRVR